MHKLKRVWNPVAEGLSYSALNTWIIDRSAFEMMYLRGYEAVENWNKNTNYGLFIQAGIEGFIKTREHRGAAKFIENEFRKQINTYTEYEDIAWWAGLADSQVKVWEDRYAADLDTHGIHESEKKYSPVITLPSGREVKLKAYIDGEGPSIIMENKCRGDYDEEAITNQIHMDLQYNMYLCCFLAATGKLPERVWYQHIRRPGGYGFRGPAKRKTESREEYRDRLVEHMNADPDYYFFRFMSVPTMDEFTRFCHACLYPMLEDFIDWYIYMIHPDRMNMPNNRHWMTPYGLYNPFVEGTQEKFRQYRLHGSTRGLRPRKV